MISRFLTLLLVSVTVPAMAAAQGTLSGQGFGFPPGQLSTRALGTGGAFAEFDPQSPINPATVALWGPAAVFVQYEPEFRVVQTGGTEAGSRLIRFPVVALGVPIGARFTFGLSSSTLLDRTSETVVRTEEIVNGEPIGSVETFRSSGAINEVRLAAGYRAGATLRLGVAVSALTGENRIFVGRIFDDPSFDSLSTRTQIGYSGFATSIGAEWRPARTIALALSGRVGGDMSAYVEDERRSTAKAPNRIGGAVAYSGIRGTSVAARYEWQGWSNMGGLGSGRVTASDTWEAGVGVETGGPRVFGITLPVRVGGRWRTLPFSADGSEVREAGVGAGFGVPLLLGRSNLDFAVQRVVRTGEAARERSWIGSLAVTVRP